MADPVQLLTFKLISLPEQNQLLPVGDQAQACPVVSFCLAKVASSAAWVIHAAAATGASCLQLLAVELYMACCCCCSSGMYCEPSFVCGSHCVHGNAVEVFCGAVGARLCPLPGHCPQHVLCAQCRVLWLRLQ